MKYGTVNKHWIVSLDGNNYKLHAEHYIFTAATKYFLNDKLVGQVEGGLFSGQRLLEEKTFMIGQHQGVFKYVSMLPQGHFELRIDDEKIEGVEEDNLGTPPGLIAILIVACLLVAWLTS